MRFFIVFLSLFSSMVLAQSSVSWKTSKRMFLVSKQEAVGINNNIKIETGFENTRYIKLIIPVSGFSSGEPERDAEVRKILQMNVQPNLVFQTKIFDAEEYKNILDGQYEELPGTLSIGNQSHPITVDVSVSGNFLTGKMKGKFTQFGIQPPTVAGGLVAKVYDELELIGRIDLKQLK